MTVNRTTLLNLSLPVTGTEPGLWGDYTNNGLTEYLDTSIAGALSITATTTLANTTGTNSSTGITTTTAQYRTLVVPAAGVSANVVITAPSSNRTYHVVNRNATYTVQIRAGANSGVTLGTNQSATVTYNTVTGDYELVGTIGPTVPVARGGTGLTSTPANGALDIGNGSGFTRTTLTAGSGVSITNGSGSITIAATGSGGTVTSVGMTVPAFLSVSGSPITGSGTLAVSLSGTALPIANGGTGTTSTTFVNLASNVTGTLPIANGGTGATSLSGANIAVTNAANTFTALQTFSGSSSVAAMTLPNTKEVCTVSATAATGTINYDVTTQSVLYYTSNASANWTVNFRGSSGTSLNTLMNTGESITVAFLVTQGATAYYNSAVQVDGASVTPKYQGGTAWSSGNASSIDIYAYTIVKTGSATFTVFVSQTKFA